MNELRRFDLEVHCLFIKVYIAQQKFQLQTYHLSKEVKLAEFFSL